MRSAPAPDLLPIPGVNQGTAVAAGDGGAGGGDGNAGEGGDGEGGSGGGGGGDAGGGGPGAGACGQGKGTPCANCHNSVAAGDPVDVMTGEVFTVPKTDLLLPGFFNLQMDRSYSTARRRHDVGFGWGWTHTFAWDFVVVGKTIKIRNSAGQTAEFPVMNEPGFESTTGGWSLWRGDRGYFLRPGSQFDHFFVPDAKDPTVYRLADITHGNNGLVAFTYEEGRLARIIDTAGRSIVCTRNSQGRIASISVPNPGGRSITFAEYQYDHGGHLVGVVDADGAVWRYRYDDDQRLIEMRLPTDLTYHYLYDRKGRCVETWGDYPGGVADRSLATGLPPLLADGQTKAKGIQHAKLHYGDGHSEVVDSVRVQRFFGQTDGKITKAVNGMGGVTTRTLDESGHETAREDPNGAVTRWTYDAAGNMLSETDAMGFATQVVRDAKGLVVETIDPAGGVVLTPRDEFGNVLMIKDQKGALTTFNYTSRGLIAEIIDARGGRTLFDWDDHANLVGRRLPNGARAQYEYDYWGRCVREVLPDGREYRFSCSDGGAVTRVDDSIGRTKHYAYDGLGNVTAVTTPDGQTTRYEHGAVGWLANVIHPNGDRVEYRFNREGWLLSETNESGEIHQFLRDRAGRLVEERMFNGAFRRYKRDLTGFLTEIDDGVGLTKFERNLLGQLVKRTAPDDTEMALSYNARGELVSAALAAVKLEYELDATGAVVRERQTVGDRSYEVVSVRDPSSLRTGVTTSLGLDLRILRDPMGDVSELRDSNGPILRYERAANGIALQRQLAQGGAVVDSYDGAWRLARRQVVTRGARVVGEAEPEWIGGAPPGTIYKTYGYSPADEVVAVTTVADGTTELEYDVRRHLLKKRASQGDETWAADPVGNYYERGATAASRSYLPGSRIAAKGSTEYAWDDRGFLTAKVRRHDNAPAERWIYHWNGLDLLSAVELPDGRSVAFEYDVYARRVEKRVTRYRQDGASDVLSTTHYVWDGSSLVHDVEVKKGEAAAARRTYLFEETDDATPIAQRDAAGAWAYYVGDVNGTPDEIIDGAGRLLGSLRRSTFGEASPTPGSQTTTPFRAPGQLADEETGLHYNRYRYYDPEIGHYISPDPIGIDGGTNLYTFGPNPIGWYDLLGWQHKMTASLTGADNQPINIPWNGNQDVSGSYLSGQRPEPDLQSANPRRDSNVHTEKQFLRDLDAYNKPKGKLDNTTATLNGQYPPCPQCHKAMRKFAKENNMKIQYTYTGPNGKPQTITYDHGSPPSGTGEGGFAAARVGPTGSGNNAEYRAQRDALMAQGVTTPPNWKRPPQ